MKRILFLSLIILSPLFIAAETVQKGKVVLQNSKGKGLSGVQIIAPKAVPVQTGNKGEFTLVYAGASAGDWAGISEVYKKGYEIVNADEVRNWVLSPKSELVIVMCPEGSLQQARERYYLSGETHYKRKYDEILAKLQKLKEQNQISADEYWEDIQTAGKELDRALTQLNEMSERLSAVNEDVLNNAEKKVWQLLDEGKFEEALDAFEKEQLKNELNRIIPSMKRYTDILKFVGGAENMEKVGRNLQQIAQVLPEDFDAQFAYAYHLRERIEYAEAIEYLEKALLVTKNDVQRAKAYREMGENYNYNFEYKKAEEYHNKAYELYLSLAQELSPAYYLKCAESLNFLGNLYYLQYKYAEGVEILKKGLELLEHEPEKDSYDYLYQKGALQGTLGVVYLRYIMYNKAENLEEAESSLTDAVGIWTELAKTNPYEINKTLTSCTSNLGVFYDKKDSFVAAETCYMDAIRLQEEIDHKYPFTVRHNLSIMYRNLGTLYARMQNKELAFKYLDKARGIDDEMVQHNHKAFIAPKLATLNNYIGVLHIFKEYAEATPIAISAVELVTPLVKENQDAYFVIMINAYASLMANHYYNGNHVEAIRTIQPIRYLIENEELFKDNVSIFTWPMRIVNTIKSRELIPEDMQDEEVKEIYEFIARYITEE